MVSTFPLFHRKIDPTYFLFRKIPWFTPKLKIFLRIVLLFWLSLHSAILLLTYLLSFYNWVASIRAILESMTYKKQKIGTFLVKKSPQFSKVVKFPAFFARYRGLQLIVAVCNQVIYFITPIGMFLFFQCAVALCYLLVRMSEIVPISLTFQAVVMLCAIIGMTHKMPPLMANIATWSIEFVQVWRQIHLPKDRVKQLDSFASLKIYIGPFCPITKKFRVDFYSALVYYTASLLISV